MSCDDNNCENETESSKPVQMRSCNNQVCSDSFGEKCLNNLEYYECGPCKSSCDNVLTCDICGPSGKLTANDKIKIVHNMFFLAKNLKNERYDNLRSFTIFSLISASANIPLSPFG